MVERVNVELPAALDSSAAAGLKELLLAQRGKDIRLDASAVERAGALCLQVLLAAQAMWRGDGKEFAVTGASPSLSFAARVAGVTQLDLGVAAS
mgnify:CR=1 FL=1